MFAAKSTSKGAPFRKLLLRAGATETGQYDVAQVASTMLRNLMETLATLTADVVDKVVAITSLNQTLWQSMGMRLRHKLAVKTVGYYIKSCATEINWTPLLNGFSERLRKYDDLQTSIQLAQQTRAAAVLELEACNTAWDKSRRHLQEAEIIVQQKRSWFQQTLDATSTKMPQRVVLAFVTVYKSVYRAFDKGDC